MTTLLKAAHNRCSPRRLLTPQSQAHQPAAHGAACKTRRSVYRSNQCATLVGRNTILTIFIATYQDDLGVRRLPLSVLMVNAA